ncbi:aldose 1-epimerase family protein [Aeoliella mucimassa]|uniref:DUF4432 domain-containing protein n=1 Tax=Aeoliella mucimassa TaxID=2527972 RepID=A0A518AK41_9BACT|nr:aldose 1-epimerase family protein [Aeoliella mucimassa]QDU55085.1 hypothetical protein Pan181_12710 [Aeoliella mucimassa]
MASSNWSVYASDTPIQYQDFAVEGLAELSASLRRLYGGLQDGVDLLTLRNGPLQIDLLPTRGMGVWKMTCDGVDIGWKSPVAGPVHPKFVNLSDPSGLGWLDGFDELIVRCGLESNGAPVFDEQGTLQYGLHGKIANRPASEVILSIDPEQQLLRVSAIVQETRFHFTKLRLRTTLTTRLGEKGFTLQDQIENISGMPATCQLLYHMNVGQPILDAGSKVIAPVKTLVPRDANAAEGVGVWETMPAPTPGLSEQVYFMDLLSSESSETEVVLHNQAATQGVACRYPTNSLPCFALWKNPVPSADGYVVGLEPATNFPNPKPYEAQHGRVVMLDPGETLDVGLRFDYLPTTDAVAAAARRVGELQSQANSQVYTYPQEGWTSAV